MNFKSKSVFSIKNISTNQTFYFYTNSPSGDEALARLNTKISEISDLQSKVDGYEASLFNFRNAFKELSEMFD